MFLTDRLAAVCSAGPWTGRPWKWVLAGLAVGLAVGWLAWPRLAFVAVTQPIRFSHAAHARQDVACAVCHFPGQGGAETSFAGLPPITVCAGCHSEPTGGRGEDQKEIDKLVNGYVKKAREVPWLVLASQPGHVLFAHGPHSRVACQRCHPDVAREDTPTLIRDRISGASKRAMPMAECQACHVSEKAATDCVACHR